MRQTKSIFESIGWLKIQNWLEMREACGTMMNQNHNNGQTPFSATHRIFSKQ